MAFSLELRNLFRLTTLPCHVGKSIRPNKRLPPRYSTSSLSDGELIYPEPPNSNHHDLNSFLEYSSRTGLSTRSTVYVGTHYEYTVQTSLRRMRMSLQRVGGASDYGIDLLGTWSLPSLSQPLKVIVQCKAYAKTAGPSVTRELEGAFVGAPIGWQGEGVMGLIVTQKAATKGVREALRRSRLPMGYIFCSKDGKIQQMLWNMKAKEEGLEGIEVGLRYLPESVDEKEVILNWKGKTITSEGFD